MLSDMTPLCVLDFPISFFHLIEQWSDYYEDDGEEAALINDTYKYYFPENYNDEDYRYVCTCILLNNAKIMSTVPS